MIFAINHKSAQSLHQQATIKGLNVYPSNKKKVNSAFVFSSTIAATAQLGAVFPLPASLHTGRALCKESARQSQCHFEGDFF